MIITHRSVTWFESEQEMLEVDFQLENNYIKHEMFFRNNTSEIFRAYVKKNLKPNKNKVI